jgi:hypothetical protein
VHLEDPDFGMPKDLAELILAEPTYSVHGAFFLSQGSSKGLLKPYFPGWWIPQDAALTLYPEYRLAVYITRELESALRECSRGNTMGFWLERIAGL